MQNPQIWSLLESLANFGVKLARPGFGSRAAYIMASVTASRQLHLATRFSERHSRQLPRRSGCGTRAMAVQLTPRTLAVAVHRVGIPEIGRAWNLDMTTDAKPLMEEFRALPDPSKREVLAELLRVSRHLDYPEMSDEELASAANDVFLAYDERETGE